jgi:uncharacterized protein
MDWTHLKPAQGRRMPWKNGGGSTLELAVEPPGATLEADFHWRLSSAEVETSGPFSSFPGRERWLMLLQGAGFRLDFGARGSVKLCEPFLPVCFQGDWPASATLVDGPCIDLNLMVDPRVCRARIEVITLKAPHAIPMSSGTTLLFVASGSLAIPAWDCHLGQGHVLRVEDGAELLQVVPGNGGATLVVMEILKTAQKSS